MPDVSKNLQDGEELLWQGQAVENKALSKVYRPVFIRKLVIGLIVLAVICFLYIRAALATDAGIKPMVIIVLIVLCLFPAVQMFYSTGKLKKMAYAATDRRLMIVTSDHVFDMPYKRIQEAAFRMDADGQTSLLCGSDAIKSRTSAWRDLTAFTHSDPNGDTNLKCESYVLYGIDRPDQLKSVLADRIPLEA